MRNRRRLTDRQKAAICRVVAFLVGVIPPAVRALQLFPVWREARVVQLRAGLGAGAVIAAVICLLVFKDTVIGTVKRHVGVMRVLLIAAVYLVLVGLRRAAPYIPRLEEIAFYALIGGLMSWGGSALAVHFQLRGGAVHGNADP